MKCTSSSLADQLTQSQDGAQECGYRPLASAPKLLRASLLSPPLWKRFLSVSLTATPPEPRTEPVTSRVLNKCLGAEWSNAHFDPDTNHPAANTL